MRNTWHFFEGRQDQQDWHRPLPNTESVWPSNVQSRKLLFFPPLTRSVLCGGAAPTPFQSPSSSQREIFTNISQLKTRSRRRCSQYPLECQLTVDFPASFFPAIFEDALPPRFSHHRERIAPEIRERIVFVCRSLTSRSLRTTNFATCFIHLWKYFSSIIDIRKKNCASFLCNSLDWIWILCYSKWLFCAAYKQIGDSII